MQFYQSGVGLNLALAQGRDLGQVFHLQLPVALWRVNSDTVSIAVVWKAHAVISAVEMDKYNTIYNTTLWFHEAPFACVVIHAMGYPLLKNYAWMNIYKLISKTVEIQLSTSNVQASIVNTRTAFY